MHSCTNTKPPFALIETCALPFTIPGIIRTHNIFLTHTHPFSRKFEPVVARNSSSRHHLPIAMASSSRTGTGENRPIHQDFIARIRYSNALPPPPHPPKLLDIPNIGLASGQYTAPSFASRLAREQPLNIEADAELGMPLDLVGMPGVFDGDESCKYPVKYTILTDVALRLTLKLAIQAPAQPPAPHPHDRALLRPLSTLGKPKVADPSVSFLRRTEYISSVTSKARPETGPLRNLNSTARRPLKRPSPEPDKDSPAYIKRKIDQSFSIAAANLKDKNRVKHPTKRNVKLLDSYPLLPDLDAFPDSGAYVVVKFTNNPVPPSKTYDRRLLNGLFRPIEKTDAEDEAYQLALQAHEHDPHNNPKPASSMNYDFYLSDSVDTADKFRQKFDVNNPNHDDDGLYTHKNSDGPNFQFTRVRAYETAQEVELNHDTKYDEEVVIAFDHDAGQKAAYYYPVMQRSTIRPQRAKNIARTIGLAEIQDQDQVIHQLDVTVSDPDDQLKQVMDGFKEHPYEQPYGGDDEEDEGAAGAGAGAGAGGEQSQQNGGGDANNGGSTPARQRSPEEDDDDQDAEGDEED